MGKEVPLGGDMSALGKFLAPLGDMTFREMVEVYKEQAQALEAAGVDFFIIETMMTLPEMRAALLAVKEVSQRPVFLTATCNQKGKTLTGSDVTALLVTLQSMGDDARLLEEALFLYQGRALYDGSLPEEVLAPLAEKYGLIF